MVLVMKWTMEAGGGSEAERSLWVSHLKDRNVFFCLLIIFPPVGIHAPCICIFCGILIDCVTAGICTALSHWQQVWPFSATLVRAERVLGGWGTTIKTA